jgi:hypothetical protein
VSEDKIRRILEEAQGVIASNRLVLGEYMGVRYISELEHKIKEVLAEPVDLTYSQEDVNKMTYQRGAEAMREMAAQASEAVARECRSALARPQESMTAHGADECALRIRNLPIPVDGGSSEGSSLGEI